MTIKSKNNTINRIINEENGKEWKEIGNKKMKMEIKTKTDLILYIIANMSTNTNVILHNVNLSREQLKILATKSRVLTNCLEPDDDFWIVYFNRIYSLKIFKVLILISLHLTMKTDWMKSYLEIHWNLWY